MPTAQVYNLHPKGPFMQTATHSQRSVLWEGTRDQTEHGLQRELIALAGEAASR